MRLRPQPVIPRGRVRTVMRRLANAIDGSRHRPTARTTTANMAHTRRLAATRLIDITENPRRV